MHIIPSYELLHCWQPHNTFHSIQCDHNKPIQNTNINKMAYVTYNVWCVARICRFDKHQGTLLLAQFFFNPSMDQ